MIGQSLGPYRIIEQIGRGGMATVYKAYHATMERDVAIKILPEHMADTPGFRERFEREARVVAKLQHPHILPVFDYGVDNDKSYLVMPYIPSGDLKQYINQGVHSLDEIANIFTKIAGALDYAHQQGILHRDIKPDNILFDASYNPLLSDFGLTKMTEGNNSLTGSSILGTPSYMSPEQGQGLFLDHRSDIYSMGILLYEMVTGEVPFSADTPVAVIFKHVSDPLPLPKVARPDLPDAAQNVILKALSKEPEQRYNSCNDMAKAFNDAIVKWAENIKIDTESDPIQDVPIEPTLIALNDKKTEILEVNEAESTTKQPNNTDTHKPRSPLPLIVIGVIILAIVAGLALMNNNNNSVIITATTSQAIAQSDISSIEETETSIAIETQDALSILATQAQETETSIADETANTLSILATQTQETLVYNVRNTATALAIALAKPTLPPTEVNIELEAQSVLSTQQAEETASFITSQTAEATLWTKTPTPDVTASIEALLTQWSVETETQEAQANATETQIVGATQTQDAQINATATQIVVATQVFDDAIATLNANATATASYQLTSSISAGEFALSVSDTTRYALRENNNSSSNLITMLNPNVIVEVLLIESDWAKIRLPDLVEGWIETTRLIEVQSLDILAQSNSEFRLAVRARRENSSDLVAMLNPNVVVEVLLIESDWAKIRLPDGSVGWIMLERLNQLNAPDGIPTSTILAQSNSDLRLAVRSEPNTSSDFVAMLNPSDTIEVLTIDSDWVYIRLPSGLIGWIEIMRLNIMPSENNDTP